MKYCHQGRRSCLKNGRWLLAALKLICIAGIFIFYSTLVSRITSKQKSPAWLNYLPPESSRLRLGDRGVAGKRNAISLPAPPAASKSAPALMIIAVYPNTDIRQAATWSQLECFAEEFEHIIISAPIQLKDNVTRFIKEVKESMPAIGSRLEGQFYANDRYDTGLWCDALLKGKTLEAYNINTGTYLGGSSRYDHFLLTNDSLMAVEKSNELLETLKAKHASVVSLNYWKNQQVYTHPWVESPARAFSLEGVQIFADNVCSLPRLRWRNHCPHLRYVKKFSGNARKQKRCIVEKTEYDVIDYYSPDKVHGLYLGHDEYFRTWTSPSNFEIWKNLRDQMSFPAMKITNGFFEMVRKLRPKDTETCTVHFKKWSKMK
eukprot:scaffold10179_cov270-Chaetoceros_neogracile.AAC.13